MREAFLTDEQWKKIGPLLPKLNSRGRPWADNRQVLEGILWVLKTGARWRDLPKQYPSPSTCWRRLRDWEEQDLWLKIWRVFLSELDARKKLDWSQCFIDGSFAPAKKGGSVSETPAKAKARSGWWVVDGEGVPLGSRIIEASPSEVKLVDTTLRSISVPRAGRGRPKTKPQRLIADRGYDSDKLRDSLKARGIELICPHRCNRRNKIQDGRKLRRYRHRWKIERTFAWLGNFRRLVVRYEHNSNIYRAFFHLACLLITLRHL